jgi:hypothetical protein
MDAILNKLYYEEHNYDGADNLYRKAKAVNSRITIKFVKEWLKKQTTNQLTSRVVGKKKYAAIYSESRHAYQIDLTFLPLYKNQNSGFYVLFTAINVNSRKAYAYYAKNKRMDTMLAILREWKQDVGPIETITCDSGNEFVNREAQEWFQQQNIGTYFVVGDSRKLGIINRFHRTLKEKLLRYFTATNNYRWVDVLAQIIHNYNNTQVRTIGMTPNEAEQGLNMEVIMQQRREQNEAMQAKSTINVGDWVRLKNERRLFEKMQLNYSPEIYQVVKVNKASVNVVSEDRTITFSAVKKDQLIVINKVEAATHDPTPAQEIRQQHRRQNRDSRAGISQSNILPSRLRVGGFLSVEN